MSAIVPAAIARRWHDAALQQLCQVAAAQAEEIQQLRESLATAEDSAEFWREQALAMQEQLAAATGAACGITQSGQLVVVPETSSNGGMES